MERSQLDISEPYKVYRIVPEGAKKGGLPGSGRLAFTVRVPFSAASCSACLSLPFTPTGDLPKFSGS